MDPAPKVGKLPEIRETLLKKRKNAARAEQHKLTDRHRQWVDKKEKKTVVFKRVESYIAQSRKHAVDLKRAKRVARAPERLYVDDEPKVAFVMRLRGINQVHPRVRKVLQLFRLLQVNAGVFVKLNEATLKMLRLVEPYVVWGYPNMKSVHDLVYKRGFGKVGGRRVALNDNKVVEEALGEHDMICVDDLIQQIHTCGPHFKQATTFLWPFKLTTPTGGWKKKKVAFVDGGDFGARDEAINALLRKMI